MESMFDWAMLHKDKFKSLYNIEIDENLIFPKDETHISYKIIENS